MRHGWRRKGRDDSGRNRIGDLSADLHDARCIGTADAAGEPAGGAGRRPWRTAQPPVEPPAGPHGPRAGRGTARARTPYLVHRHGSRTITAETAILLGRRFGTGAELWMDLRTAHDLAVARGTMSASAGGPAPPSLTHRGNLDGPCRHSVGNGGRHRLAIRRDQYWMRTAHAGSQPRASRTPPCPARRNAPAISAASARRYRDPLLATHDVRGRPVPAGFRHRGAPRNRLAAHLSGLGGNSGEERSGCHGCS